VLTANEQAFEERYRQWARRSGELFTEASRYIPGGAGSSARTVKFGWKPYTPFMAEGSGSRLRDVDGHQYVDYLLGLGPMILGHRHPAVTRAVTRAVSAQGSCFGLPYELEVEAARKVTEAVPGIELVRFSNSGSVAASPAADYGHPSITPLWLNSQRPDENGATESIPSAVPAAADGSGA
jgi:glutamate-1-semialdehyde 2,1-aminomutase